LGDLAIRFIFPHAPMRSVTINEGEEMRAWYDFIPHSETGGSSDIEISAALVQELIDKQTAKGISHDRIILAGFSQGGVIALQLGLRLDKRIAGIVALSTYLHDAIKTEEQRHDANLALPILMVHGTMDPMIPIMRAATSRENLIRLGYDVQWKDYPMGHQVCLEELGDISAFLRSCL
jgi:phospholipase/carboxylesterase